MLIKFACVKTMLLVHEAFFILCCVIQFHLAPPETRGISIARRASIGTLLTQMLRQILLRWKSWALDSALPTPLCILSHLALATLYLPRVHITNSIATLERNAVVESPPSLSHPHLFDQSNASRRQQGLAVQPGWDPCPLWRWRLEDVRWCG